MRSRLVVVFIVGVLVGAVLLGGGAAVLQHSGEDAQAQSAGTWQLQIVEKNAVTDSVVIEDIAAWVTSLPAACDLVPSIQGNMYFYRCPSS